MLAAALVVAIGAEWPRVERLLGTDARRRRDRSRRKASFKVIRSDAEPEDDFAASVQRDLDSLPTIEERDRR